LIEGLSRLLLAISVFLLSPPAQQTRLWFLFSPMEESEFFFPLVTSPDAYLQRCSTPLFEGVFLGAILCQYFPFSILFSFLNQMMSFV